LPATLNRRGVAFLSMGLGMGGWCLGLRFGPGPTALNAGALYLVALGAAGLVVGFLEGEVSWEGLLGLYLGQVLALGGQVLLGFDSPEPEALLWEPLFILSVTLAAAVGSVLGASLAQARARSRQAEGGS
jgi:hypothetical protein